METLRDIYNRHSQPGDAGFGDKGNHHSYIEVYEELLAPYRNKEVTVMEIGIARGHSIVMWGEYFTKGHIYGVDIWDGFDWEQFNSDKYTIIIADASKPELLDKVGDTTFDIIIDDGSHDLKDQTAAFISLHGKVNKGGLYIIEDAGLTPEYVDAYKLLYPSCEILDRSTVKGLWNDVLVIYRF